MVKERTFLVLQNDESRNGRKKLTELLPLVLSAVALTKSLPTLA